MTMQTIDIFTDNIDGDERSWSPVGEPFAVLATDIPFEAALWYEDKPEYILGIVVREGVRIHTTERIFEAQRGELVEVVETRVMS